MLDYDGCLSVILHLIEGNTRKLRIAKIMNIASGSLPLAMRAYMALKVAEGLGQPGLPCCY